MSEDWEALPKRTRNKRPAKAVAGSGVGVGVGGKTAKVAYEDRLAMITQSVSERSEANKATSLASLTSLDGCAGDNYEYLDHTADVQCHTWGPTLKEAFETMGACMFNYMTDLSTVEINPDETRTIKVQTHDMQSLLFKYMDEMLFKFCSESFCIKKVEIVAMDVSTFAIEAKCYGNIYDPLKNPPGTEIKAITYSNMQIHETSERSDLYVIVDI